MLAEDKSSIAITFAHETLKYGKCYKLMLSNHTQMTTRVKNLDKEAKVVCGTKCERCNKHGSDGCNEAFGQCICRPNYEGSNCDSCIKGYTMDHNQ